MPETNQNCNTTDAAPNVADQAPTVVVQVNAEDLKQAVHDTIIEMRQNATASSKTAIPAWSRCLSARPRTGHIGLFAATAIPTLSANPLAAKSGRRQSRDANGPLTRVIPALRPRQEGFGLPCRWRPIRIYRPDTSRERFFLDVSRHGTRRCRPAQFAPIAPLCSYFRPIFFAGLRVEVYRVFDSRLARLIPAVESHGLRDVEHHLQKDLADTNVGSPVAQPSHVLVGQMLLTGVGEHLGQCLNFLVLQ